LSAVVTGPFAILATSEVANARLAYPPFHPSSQAPAPLVLAEADFHTHFPAEGEYVEFKEGVSGRAIQDAVVAFSNTAGGVVLIGVRDDATIVGRDLTQSVEESLHQTVADTRNPGRYTVHRVVIGERPIVVLSIAPRVEGFSQTSTGRVLVRRGPRNVALFDSDLLRFVTERALERFEQRPSTVMLRDVDAALIQSVADAFGWSEDTDVFERLAELQLVTADGRLTIAGALYLQDDPARVLGKAYVEILRFPNDSGDYDRRLEIRGPLHQQVRAATAAILDELGTELVVLGVQRHELPRIPTVVLREALANAVAHRSYEDNRTAVRVEMRPTSVTISSPGPLPVPVTVENIRDAQAPRNLNTIRVLRRFGLAEDAGRGVDVMQDSMRAELLEPPVFTDTGHSVLVELPVRSAVTARERAWVRELERRGHIVPSDRILLIHAARGEVLTNRRARELASLDRVEATRALQRLTRMGFLRQSGRRGGSLYTLDGSLGPPAGLRLTEAEMRGAILAIASDRVITNAHVRAQLGIDRAEALKLLDGLVRDGQLERRGERRGSHYILASRR
jgi:ATP-dependent DNA helicase RecG